LIAQANVLIPVQLAEAHLQAGGKRIVAIGSCWEFVQGKTNAMNTYAASKVAARQMLGAMVAERQASLCWLALSDTFGADDPRPKIFNSVRQAIRSGSRLMMTSGDQIFDPVAADDAARAIALSCLVSEPSGIWGVAGGEPAPLREKIEAYCALVGKGSPCDWGAKPYRFGEPFSIKWKTAPPWWCPAASFADALREMERQPGGLLNTR
jgi:nucleoside-diphosphate-sugar epimerase